MPETTIHKAKITWTGAAKGPTDDYNTFSRDHDVEFDNEWILPASAGNPTFGDPRRVDPEEMLVGALSSCHMLTFLAVAARKRILITGYVDEAEGVMEQKDGKMRVTKVTLRPRITYRGEVDKAQLERTDHLAHENCVIANSVACEIVNEPTFVKE